MKLQTMGFIVIVKLFKFTCHVLVFIMTVYWIGSEKKKQHAKGCIKMTIIRIILLTLNKNCEFLLPDDEVQMPILRTNRDQ